MFTNRPLLRNKVTYALAVLGLLCFIPWASAGETEDQDIDLTAMSFKELMDMEITAVSKKEEKLFATPASVHVISNEDIRRSGHQSIPEVLRMVPGIQVAKIDTNKWAITARGFNSLYSEKLLVLIDGRTVYTPLTSGVNWDVQDLMLEDVERIEVVKGPGGTLWGANAVNGIINIITKDARDTQGNLFVAGAGTEESGFSSLRHGGKLGENAHFRTYAKYFDRDEAVYTNGDTANDGTDAIRGGFRIDWDKSEQDHITLQSDSYNGHSSRRVTRPAPPPSGNYRVNNIADLRGTNVLTRWTRMFSDGSDMALQFYYDRTERYEVSIGESRDTFDVDFQHHFQLMQTHNLVWGFGYRHTDDNIDNRGTITHAPSRRSDELLTGFVQNEMTVIDDRLKFIVGIKVEDNDYTGFEYQPNARLLWTPNEKNTVWASFTRAVSTPSRMYSDSTLIYNYIPATMSISGSQDLDAQEVQAWELGYRMKPKDNLFFDFSVFYNEYDHLFALRNNPTAFTTIYDNTMYGETCGTEIAAHWQVNDNWVLGCAYSFLTLQMHTEDSSTNTNAELRTEKSSPHNTFNLNSRLNLGKSLEFDTSLYYVDNVPQYDIPAYMRLDMGLTWHLKENMDLSLVGQNLLDSSHPEFGSDSVIPTEVQRGVFGKLTWRFK
jgi:iron complex outermembrane recepter protein